jgi:Zn finger protein HypA/HybF involved in hydrogenase expression
LDKWKAGKANGTVGISAKNISGHVRKYLFEKYENKCSICGWNKVNPHSGRFSLEIDHIDGDSENSIESNLRLLCPNCHSLTPHFRNLNKGKGRKWRMNKYKKN